MSLAADAWPLAAGMALLLIAALLLATRPWWRGQASGLRRRQANVAAYRSRLAEIEAERDAGLIAADTGDALTHEAASRLIAEAQLDVESESGGRSENVESPAPRRKAAIAILGLALALFAGGGYWLIGTWRAAQEIAVAQRGAAEIADMVGRLAQKLEAHPEDANGWALLGRSYFILQRYGEAAKAYEQANVRATAPEAAWLTDEGEALAFANDGEADPRAAALFARALALAPDDGKTLWYAGLSAAQAGEAAHARELWSRLARQDLPPQMHEMLEARLAELPGATPPNPGLPAKSLRLHVELAPQLAGKVPDGAWLLVFARAESGPPMPLAVQKLAHPQLPVDVTLDDRQAMSPALKLSQFDRYRVTARLSRGGMAQAQAGDLEGELHASAADLGKSLRLEIDSVVR